MSHGQSSTLTSHLVDGYYHAFVDSSKASDPSYTPKFVTNSNGSVRSVIENELKGCHDVFMSVAFITQGGIAPFLGYFKELETNNVRVRVLTTDYLMFSDPSALDKLSSLSNTDVRMFRTGEAGIGFHTKGYLFHKDGDLRILIGSSNLTQSAISRNHEWNTMMVTSEDGQFAQDVENEFENVWDSSVSYETCREDYKREFNDKSAERKELKKIFVSLDSAVSKVVEPNEMQSEFCLNVEKLVRDGQKRALLISATGTGKTFASAFAIRSLFADTLLSKKKVLFLSHREQINSQAIKSYKKVLGNGFVMEALSGGHCDENALKRADFVFSTMQMMSKDELRSSLFSPEHFSMIILDECHRSGSEGYQRIISYFKPEFLLGMSASPERNDGFDIYQQFDHNIACEIRLQTALENDLLCPFHYFGITDISLDNNNDADENGAVSNNSELMVQKESVGNGQLGAYNNVNQGVDDNIKKKADVFRRLTSDERVDRIISAAKYYGYSGDRVKGLIFCSNKKEGAALSAKFNEKGYRTVFLSGDDKQSVREGAVSRLVCNDESKWLDYIITVDIFNEGVDIPEINQIIMLRPTESAIVFVQQLGRGLRKAEDKEYVVILDFIGNYNSNYLIPVALSGDRTGNKDNIRRQMINGDAIVKGASSIYFDEIAKQRIFASIDKAQMNNAKALKEAYKSLKMKLGRRPQLIEFDEYDEIDPMRFIACKGSYHSFLVAYDDLIEAYNVQQQRYMNFISEKFASGKRPHELELLSLILDNPSSSDLLDRWKESMSVKYNITVNSIVQQNVRNIMTSVFYAIGTAKVSYENLDIISCVSGNDSNDKWIGDDEILDKGGLNECHDGVNVYKKEEWYVNEGFRQLLTSEDFRKDLKSVVEFGMSRYMKNYSKREYGSAFVIGQKYTYEDVCRLLCWEKNVVALNVGGYKYDEYTGTYPVFINYHKEDDINDTTKYEDRFIDRGNLIAISKSKRTISSSDVDTAIHAEERGVAMELFVRKNKDDNESKEFYYLGRISHNGFLKEFVMPNTEVTAVEIGYRLLTPVEQNLYDYLTSSEGSDIGKVELTSY